MEAHRRPPESDDKAELIELRARVARLEALLAALSATNAGAAAPSCTTVPSDLHFGSRPPNPQPQQPHSHPQPPQPTALRPLDRPSEQPGQGPALPSATPSPLSLDAPAQGPQEPPRGPLPPAPLPRGTSSLPQAAMRTPTSPPTSPDDDGCGRAVGSVTKPTAAAAEAGADKAADEAAAKAAVHAAATSATDGGGSGAGAGAATAVVPGPISVVPCVPMAATRVVMHQLVLPADVNQLGICTGGQVLSWIDVCAGLSAKTLAHGPCVTASVDAVHFLRPCRLGCVVMIAAMVARTFKTSMEVLVVVESEDMRTGVRHHCCSAHLTFVVRPLTSALCGAAAGLPRVYPTTREHRAVWEGAEVRRQLRLERRTSVRRNPELLAAERACRLQPITHREGGPTLPPAVTLTSPKALRMARGATASSTQPLSPHASAAPVDAAADAAPADAAGASDGPCPGADCSTVPAATPLPSPLASRQRVTPDCTTAYMTQSIMPQHANTLHITFGGQVMSWMEQCAYISASRLRAPALLTAAMDSVSFVQPTRVGDILYITAQVSAIFGSSLEVMVSVFGENPFKGAGSGGAAAKAAEAGGGDAVAADSGVIFHCADAFVTVVAVDERQASPVPVPFELDPRAPPDVLRYQGAVARRAERLALRGQFAAGETSRMSLDGGLTYSPPPEPAEGSSVLEAMPPL